MPSVTIAVFSGRLAPEGSEITVTVVFMASVTVPSGYNFNVSANYYSPKKTVAQNTICPFAILLLKMYAYKQLSLKQNLLKSSICKDESRLN